MAVAFRAASGSQSSTAASSFSVTQPTGTVAGDLVIVAINVAGLTTFNAVTGWTLDSSTQNNAAGGAPFTTGIYWRVLDGTESWPISFTCANSGKFAWVAAGWNSNSSGLMRIDNESAVKVNSGTA